MNTWKRNLVILWLGGFFASAGIGMIVPFLPLYVQELGVEDIGAAAIWSAMIFGINHLMTAIVSPVWGRISDQFGYKNMMIISGCGLTVVICAMGTVSTPLQLLILRACFGLFGGFYANSVSLMAVETPKQEVGRTLGTLQTGNVSGQLFGPLMGGILAGLFGMRSSFFITGSFIAVAVILIIWGVRETRPYTRFRLSIVRDALRRVKGRLSPAGLHRAGDPGKGAKPKAKPDVGDIVRQSPVMFLFFLTTFLFAFSMQSVGPIISLYVSAMNVERFVELFAGLVFAATALGTIIASPFLGKLGDRYGHGYILIAALLLLAISHLPQAEVNQPWSFMLIRFFTGIGVGGIIPSVQALLRQYTPVRLQGSVFGYNQSAMSLGNVSGAMTGGLIAASFGIPMMFYMVGGILFVHFLIMFIKIRSWNVLPHDSERSAED